MSCGDAVFYMRTAIHHAVIIIIIILLLLRVNDVEIKSISTQLGMHQAPPQIRFIFYYLSCGFFFHSLLSVLNVFCYLYHERDVAVSSK